jgi:hypothetical protein
LKQIPFRVWVQRRISALVVKVVFIKKENGFSKRNKTGIELNDFIQVLEAWV